MELEESSRTVQMQEYRRSPMGHCAAPDDAYMKRFDDFLAGLQRTFKCIDDTLLHDKSVERAFWHAYDMLCQQGHHI